MNRSYLRKEHSKQRCAGPRWWKDSGKLKLEILCLAEQGREYELGLKKISAECWEDEVSPCQEAIWKLIHLGLPWQPCGEEQAAQPGRPVISSCATNQGQRNTMVT